VQNSNISPEEEYMTTVCSTDLLNRYTTSTTNYNQT